MSRTNLKVLSRAAAFLCLADGPTNPWLYLEFTADGLRKVELDDLEALDSTDCQRSSTSELFRARGRI